MNQQAPASVSAQKFVALQVLAAVGLFGICTLFVQRAVIASGFDLVEVPMGTPAPTIMVIMNHWYDVFAANRPWQDLSFFYPQVNTLGYSDTFFIFGLITAGLRSLGFDMFSAFQLFLVISPLIGFGFCFFMLRFQLQLHWLIASLCALFVAYPLPFLQSWHFTQLCAVHFLPPILVSGYACGVALARSEQHRACGFAALTGLQLGMLFYNSFYLPWFFVLLLCVATVVSLLILRTPIVRLIRDHTLLKSFGVATAGFTGAFALAMVPFYLTYSTALKTFGTFNKRAIRDTLPLWYDYINVGRRSLVWSSTFSSWFPFADRRPMAHELEFGTTPVLLLTFLCCGIYLVRARKRISDANWYIGMIAFCCVVIYWLLMLRVGVDSAWTGLVLYMPGAKAIRAVFRANLVLYIPMAIVIAIATNATINLRTHLFTKWPLIVIVALAIVGEQQVVPSRGYSAAEQRHMLAQIGPLPEPCRAFLLTHVPASNEVAYYQRQAQVWSSALGIPTANGYSSHFPPGYTVYPAHLPAYKQAMKAWLEQTQSTNEVCGLNYETLKFYPLAAFLDSP